MPSEAKDAMSEAALLDELLGFLSEISQGIC